MFAKRKMAVSQFLTLNVHTLAAQCPGMMQTRNLNVHVMEACLMPMEKELKDLLPLRLSAMKLELRTESYELESL
jgi:hypothetical protein